MLQRALAWPEFDLATHANPLSGCVPRGQLPTTDQPTAQQRAEVDQLLQSDITLYDELRDRFKRKYREAFGESA